MSEPEIWTKSNKSPVEARDGVRVLITRYCRGAKAHDAWERRLAPSAGLLKLAKAGKVDWPEFRRRFEAELALPDGQAALAEWRERAQRETITIICFCSEDNEETCHRSVVFDLL